MFKINDKVIVKAYGRSAGREPATIIDMLTSATSDETRYKVKFDRDGYVPSRLFEAAGLEVLEERAEYSFSFDVSEGEQNVVVAVAKKTVNGVTTELGRGYGHILHEGDDGFVQAASYALKRIWSQRRFGKKKIQFD